MKGVAAVLLVIASHVALAQNKDNIYVDVGINSPGVSATYDRKLTRKLDVGLGLSFHDLNEASYGNVRTACFVDIRPFRVIRRNLLFVFADVGVAMLRGREPDSATLQQFSLYTSVGFGYRYQINKRGMGPYVSLGMYGYTENVHYKYLPPAPKRPDYSVFDADLLLSVGFKF